MSRLKREPGVLYLADIDAAKDAELGGLGLGWDIVPESLSVRAASIWADLGRVFSRNAVRFRESDRTLLARYCAVSALADEAEVLLFAGGLMIEGRSSADAARTVKNPANQLLRDYVMMQLALARALGLGPVARTRQGIRELELDEVEEW